VEVLTTKQKPRRLKIFGSDGKEYNFLLKGHEDLRLDERIMQLLDLVNNLLSTNSETKKKDLTITRYEVIVLSSNVGLLEWVENTETIYSVVKSYRNSKKVRINLEYLLRKYHAPNYEQLTLFQKLEIFELIIEKTSGQDIYKVLWLSSKNSEIWLDKRTNFTKSIAVMSIVGYIIGLGNTYLNFKVIDTLVI
jgi:FKBP12-rapamycin complex-associated protein